MPCKPCAGNRSTYRPRPRRTLFRSCRTAFLLTIVAIAPVAAQERRDTISDLQSQFGFNSIMDGQPNEPAQFQVRLSSGVQHLRGSSALTSVTFQPSYTPDGSPLLRGMEIGLSVQLQVSGGTATSNFVSFWQQRWVADTTRMLSLATLIQLDVGSNVTPSAVASLVKSFARTTIYVNGQVESENGDGITQWLAATGVAVAFDRVLPLIDVVHVGGSGQPVQNIVELSATIRATESLNLGLGVAFGIAARPGGEVFGGGIVFSYVFR